MIGKYKKQFAEILDQYIENLSVEEILNLIETPPENISGDLGFPCFGLSKILRKAPNVIAGELVTKLNSVYPSTGSEGQLIFSGFEAVGPYVNVHLNRGFLAKDVLVKIFDQKEKFGSGEKQSETILVESPGPNTNKPLHLGHVRNLLLGNSVENILKFAGYDVKRVDIINNRGVHICKSMLAYQLFGDNAEPNKKSDHFVGDWYVEYSKQFEKNPELEIQVRDMLVKRENGDIETRNLWEKMNSWAMDGMAVTYKRYGTKIEKAYLESDYYLKGKEKVLEEFEKGTFVKNAKGHIVFQSANEHWGEKTVLRSDGTSIYSTNDIGVVQGRFDDFAMNKMVYVVGNEQEDYFKVLFEIFEALKYPFAKDCFHLSYGMISLPSGKMKSREGKVIDADNLADEMHAESKKMLVERFPDLGEIELNKKSEAIAMAAIKFFILKYDVGKNFIFNPEDSLSFDGETGPYLQYSYARIGSVLRKSDQYEQVKGQWFLRCALDDGDVDFGLLVEVEEKNLLLKMAEFSDVVKKSAKNYKPNLVARFSLELAKLFNNYYHKHKIIQDNKKLEKSRLGLIFGVKILLENSLSLLGIDVLEEM